MAGLQNNIIPKPENTEFINNGKKNVHSASLKGLRPQNEDNHVIFINLDGSKPNFNNINFYAIFDGHGGVQVSNYLKQNLPKYFLDKRTVYPLQKNFVNEVFDQIQNDIMKHGFAQRCGSTCLIVIHFIKNNEQYLNVINLGDCRCILNRDNFAMPLTKDHKPAWPEEKLRIENLGGTISFDGYDWRIKDLSVSRAFGDLDATPFVTHRPELFRYKLDKNDKFFILTCDGSIESLDNFDLVNFILGNSYDLKNKVRINKDVNVAKKLAQHAIDKGSHDNVSITIIFLE